MTDTKHAAIAVATHAPLERMHPLVAQMMSLNPDPSTLRELLAIQREWEAGEAKREFTTALVGLKRALPSVISRDARVHFESKRTGDKTDYTHATLAHVLTEVEEPMTSLGFTLTWEPGSAEKGQVQVTCKLTHQGGHTETCTLAAPPDTSGNKNPAQAIASTITLLERYTACALLGLATKDMEEPQPTEPPERRVDPARNMKAAAWAAREGKSREDAEGYLGKPVSAWTEADLAELKAWVRSAEREPVID